AAHPGTAMEPVEHAICGLIETAARANHLPVGFMTRIIWRESSFRPGAVSPVGAQGIAQFMPGTAQQRGLADPFDPQQAIPEAAHLLADLRLRFGNLGVAAAAYNAGPARVAVWLRGQEGLPAETRAYVRFVTKRDVQDWTGLGPGPAAATPAAAQSCLAVADALRREESDAGDVAFGPLAPWGVQLAGNFSKAVALASFERARRRYGAIIGDQLPMILGRRLRSRGTRRFYEVRLPAASRAIADAVCRRIRSVGGACVALHS
ncbi:MAG TPA: lytic transglycosylase domain-containing protein, partial [Stellaceae bacterium]|nr:lytic transglycosylase domain-containing protein [Stellaceae bacterium]